MSEVEIAAKSRFLLNFSISPPPVDCLVTVSSPHIMSRLTLAQQLKQLEEDAPRSLDPESAYTSLDSLNISKDGNQGKEHYLDVGPSKLRSRQESAGQTLLSNKYAGQTRGRVKIFDDDNDDEEEEDNGDEADDDDNEDLGSDSDDMQEEDDEDEDENEENTEEEEAVSESDEGERDLNGSERSARFPAMESKTSGTPSADPAPRLLDPLGSLRESRLKDIEKGRAIRKQKVRIM
jgi:protein AATF/BFR2